MTGYQKTLCAMFAAIVVIVVAGMYFENERDARRSSPPFCLEERPRAHL